MVLNVSMLYEKTLISITCYYLSSSMFLTMVSIDLKMHIDDFFSLVSLLEFMLSIVLNLVLYLLRVFHV